MLGSFLSAMALIVYGFVTVCEIVWDMPRAHEVSGKGAKIYAVEFIELTDTFLLGTILYIVALGLYDLFIDQDLPMPSWLHITDLDELKEKLIGVIIVLLAVTFLGDIVAAGGKAADGTTMADAFSPLDLLYLGGAVAAVMLALSVLRWVDRRPQSGGGKAGRREGGEDAVPDAGRRTPDAGRRTPDAGANR